MSDYLKKITSHKTLVFLSISGTYHIVNFALLAHDNSQYWVPHDSGHSPDFIRNLKTFNCLKRNNIRLSFFSE